MQVDERAVLKHFDWPENKADALREAAFEYLDLKKLCTEISTYEDDLRVPTDSALKKMLAALEKYVSEHTVYIFSSLIPAFWLEYFQSAISGFDRSKRQSSGAWNFSTCIIVLALEYLVVSSNP